MEESQKPFFEPSYLTKVVDLVSRTVRGQLHLPPWWLRDVGGADFEATGREFLNLFVQVGNLQRGERVLEIGCGCGRMALPLTGYLSPEGSYVGMDVTEKSISWCRQNIARRYPNFEFLHADLYNKRYNPNGRHLAKDYTFPLPDDLFDFIFLTSVFAHMLPEDAENYLREIARLLCADGRALITFFLLNDVQQALASQGQNDIDFRCGSGSYRTRNEAIPESAVAYDEAFLHQLLERCRLELCGPVRHGTWSGREDGTSYQDILLVGRQ